MQCYTLDGELVDNFKISFDLVKPDADVVRRSAVIHDEIVELGDIRSEGYVEEIHDPFWISDCDSLYFNSEFEYTGRLRESIARQISQGGQPDIDAFEISARGLASLGLGMSHDRCVLFKTVNPFGDAQRFPVSRAAAKTVNRQYLQNCETLFFRGLSSLT